MPKLPRAVKNRVKRTSYGFFKVPQNFFTVGSEATVEQPDNWRAIPNDESFNPSKHEPHSVSMTNHEGAFVGRVSYLPPLKTTLGKYNALSPFENPLVVDMSADMKRPRGVVNTDSVSLYRSGILEGERDSKPRLNRGRTLKSLAHIRNRFPDLKEIKVNVEYPDASSPHYQRELNRAREAIRTGEESLLGEGGAPTTPTKFYTRTIKLRRGKQE